MKGLNVGDVYRMNMIGMECASNSSRLTDVNFKRDDERLPQDLTGREWVFGEIERWLAEPLGQGRVTKSTNNESLRLPCFRHNKPLSPLFHRGGLTLGK